MIIAYMLDTGVFVLPYTYAVNGCVLATLMILLAAFVSVVFFKILIYSSIKMQESNYAKLVAKCFGQVFSFYARKWAT